MNLLLTVFTSAACAAGLPETLLAGGYWNGPVSARATGMGVMEFMDFSVLGSLTNPATASLSGPGLGLQLAGGMDLSVEKRTRTVYDEFGSSIGEAEHAFNSGADLIPGGLGLSLSGAGGLPGNLFLALGWMERESFGYGYDRTVTDDYYVTVGREELSAEGFLGEICASAALAVSDMVAVGIGGGWLDGYRDTRWTRTWVDPTIPETDDAAESEISGMVGRASVMVTPFRSLRVCLGAEKAMSMAWTGDIDGDVSLPPRLRLGALWLPGNILRTRFSTEMTWYAASGAEFDGSDMGLRDCWSASAGVENLIPGGPACRFGFRYDKSPLSRVLDSVSFTGGLGFELDGWALDAGACFTPRSWDQQDLPDMVSFTTGDSLRVEETRTMLRMSASRAFSL